MLIADPRDQALPCAAGTPQPYGNQEGLAGPEGKGSPRSAAPVPSALLPVTSQALPQVLGPRGQLKSHSNIQVLIPRPLCGQRRFQTSGQCMEVTWSAPP